MGHKITMTPEGVEALRQWSDVFVLTIENIISDTEKLIQDLNRVDRVLGVHENLFKQMILHVQKAVVISLEAVEVLPEMMRVTADKMEAYIYNLPYDENPSSDSGWQKVRKR